MGGRWHVSSLSRMWSDDDLIDCDLCNVCASSDTITPGLVSHVASFVSQSSKHDPDVTPLTPRA